MALKLSIFTTITKPVLRGDHYQQSLACYEQLADEVVVVNGNLNGAAYGDKAKNTTYVWPKEFDWKFIGQQFTRGYEACTGDVVIHADLDFIFHEKDFKQIREAAELMLDMRVPAVSFWKYQFIQPDRYNLKSRLVVMVNKRDFGDRIKFDAGGDLCQPSLDGVELSAKDVPEARIAIYNYEKIIKTKQQVADDVGRMDRAYRSHFRKDLYCATGFNKDAFNGWLKMVKGRNNKPQNHIELQKHPIYMQEIIKQLTPNQFGYNGFGSFKENKYV